MRAYGYEGAQVVGDDADGEEDAVLRHHGRALGGGEGCAGVLAFWVRDAVAGPDRPVVVSPARRA